MPKSAKETIKKNFSKYALTYDKYAFVQHETAKKLARMLPENARNILDIGCGTGIFTKLIKDKYQSPNILALDLSPQMISVAKKKLGNKVMFVSGDAEEIDIPVKFDLIASNATFQWFRKMDSTLAKYKKLLEKKGSIIFSTFGPLTYHELSRTLKEVLKKNVFISSNMFISKVELEHMIKKHFSVFSVSEVNIIEKNRSISELLKKIKYTGTHGYGIMGTNYLGKEMLKKMDEHYKAKHKNLETTYQIFFCEARA